MNTQTTEIEFTFSCDAINLHIDVPVTVEFTVNYSADDYGRTEAEIEVIKVSLTCPAIHHAFESTVKALDEYAVKEQLWDHLGPYLLEQAA